MDTATIQAGMKEALLHFGREQDDAWKKVGMENDPWGLQQERKDRASMGIESVRQTMQALGMAEQYCTIMKEVCAQLDSEAYDRARA